MWCEIVGVCIFRGLPLITVTMGDSVESRVKDSITPGLTGDDVKAVVVITAASVCAHKDP